MGEVHRISLGKASWRRWNGWDKVQLATQDTRCHSIIGGYVAWALPPHIMDGDNEGSQVGEHRYSVESSYLKTAVRTASK